MISPLPDRQPTGNYRAFQASQHGESRALGAAARRLRLLWWLSVWKLLNTAHACDECERNQTQQTDPPSEVLQVLQGEGCGPVVQGQMRGLWKRGQSAGKHMSPLWTTGPRNRKNAGMSCPIFSRIGVVLVLGMFGILALVNIPMRGRRTVRFAHLFNAVARQSANPPSANPSSR